MSQFDIISDQSRKKLYHVPKEVLHMVNLKMLYLEGNSIKQLPEDFFLKLHKLTWLDLRNNKIKEIPENVAYHEHLENLLLTNNRIEKLPNELGVVPNLKVLQVAENPIVYPSRKVIAEGIRSILGFLKTEYQKATRPPPPPPSPQPQTQRPLSDDSGGGGGLGSGAGSAEDTEQELAVVEDTGSGYIAESDEAHSAKEVLRRSVRGKLHRGDEMPAISVRGLSRTPQSTPSTHHGDVKPKSKERIVHKITRDIGKMKSNFERMQDVGLKEEWLSRLKMVLQEQETILQQEKNLQALSSWRSEKKLEPERSVHEAERATPPFATDADYDKVMSREDLSRQIDKMIQRSRHKPKKSNVEKLINDLVSELKDMENTYIEMKSPRAEIEEAGKQIKLIMNIHKKLMRLQGSNDSTL